MEIKTNVSVRVPDMTEIRSRFTGREWAALCAKIAADMGAQVRGNLRKHGRPGGDFAPLSGFNGASTMRRSRMGSIASEKSMLTQGFSEEEAQHIRSGSRFRNLSGRQAKWRARSRHRGYARRKEAGKTPGKGRYGPDAKLFDTEAMAKSITGIVVVEGTTTRVFVDAPGQAGDRPTNNELLLWHATGAGNLPVRNPADPAEMKAFEARVKRRLEEILAKPPPPAPPPA